jgi:serine kinase of HPr protein (carbohydrate metabolism regulator)
MILHAGLIARRMFGQWRGVLIQGPPGAGKSDLALRALDAGWRLVADDRTLVFSSAGILFGRAPDRLAGLIEARGLDVVSTRFLRFAPIALAVACDVEAGGEARAPEPRTREILGIALPEIDLWPLAASAPSRMALALERLGGGLQR